MAKAKNRFMRAAGSQREKAADSAGLGAEAGALAEDGSTKVDTPAEATRGLFITFEGGEGAGKSTHIRFLGEVLEKHGYEVVRLREPGGTSIGEDLRAVVLNAKNTQMADECELLIYEAARAQIVSEIIRPALERGAIVLCDRFADSTVAYQAYGRGLSREFVQEANRFATQGTWPDRTIVMVCDNAAEGLERATHRFGADRLELAGLDFHERVNAAFLELAAADPERMRIVHSDRQKSETSKLIFGQLKDLFPWMEELLPDDAFFAPLNSKRKSAGDPVSAALSAAVKLDEKTGEQVVPETPEGASAGPSQGPDGCVKPQTNGAH